MFWSRRVEQLRISSTCTDLAKMHTFGEQTQQINLWNNQEHCSTSPEAEKSETNPSEHQNTSNFTKRPSILSHNIALNKSFVRVAFHILRS